MPSRYLHPLVCTKCGAALPAEEGQQILVCPYCGQSHAFIPPPLEPGPGQAPSPSAGHIPKLILVAVGVVVIALAAFMSLHASRNAESTSPSGASQAASESTTRGPGDPKAVYSKGQVVDIHWGSSWWPGSVVSVDGSKYRAHYEGYGSGSDEWVRADRLRPRAVEDASAETTAAAAPDARTYPIPATGKGDPNATYEAGEGVEVHWGSSWFLGAIKKKDGKRYFIGYDGYSSSWDEWVTAERLRKRGAD